MNLFGKFRPFEGLELGKATQPGSTGSSDDDFPEYFPMEAYIVDGGDVVIKNFRSSRAGINVRRRVSESLRTVKRGLRRMTCTIRRDGIQCNDAATDHIELGDELTEQVEPKKQKSEQKRRPVKRLKDKLHRWATSIKSNGRKNRNDNMAVPSPEAAESDSGVRFIRLEGSPFSFDEESQLEIFE